MKTEWKQIFSKTIRTIRKETAGKDKFATLGCWV